MKVRLLVGAILGVGLVILVSRGPGTCLADAPDAEPAYVSADVIVEYRDRNGKEGKHWQKFRVEDAKVVAEMAAHFPGILGDRGSGPRSSRGWKSKFTILFHHRSGDKSKVRALHLSPDYASWFWRDNTPYTGDRKVEAPSALRKLIEQLASKYKVELE